MPSVLAILWDTINYGSLESSGVSLAPKKIELYKEYFWLKHLFLDPRPGSKSPLPRRRNEGWPQRLKSVWHTSFGPYYDSDHKTCAGQLIEQDLLIDTVDRKGENGRVDPNPDLTLLCWRLAKSSTVAILLLSPNRLTPKCPWQTGTQLYTCIAFIFWSSAKHHFTLVICLCTADED